MTALIVAVKGGYTEVVKELLKRNPNVNMTDKDGNTALAIAAKEGHIEIVQDLLDAGTYVNVPDRVRPASGSLSQLSFGKCPTVIVMKYSLNDTCFHLFLLSVSLPPERGDDADWRSERRSCGDSASFAQ